MSIVYFIKDSFSNFQNKVFVYRGLEYERIGAFTQRLQTEFPQAQILMKSTTPDDSILNSDGQCILINLKDIIQSDLIILLLVVPKFMVLNRGISVL